MRATADDPDGRRRNRDRSKASTTGRDRGTLFTPIPLPGAVFDEDDEDDGPFPGEERSGNPEEDLVDTPSVDVPEVEAPSVRNPADGLPDPSSVDPEVSGPFLIAVIYANVALFGVSLGLMLVGFRGEWRWGGAATLVGLFAAVRVYQTYRAFEARRAEREADDAPAGSDAPPGDEGRDDAPRVD